MKNSSRIAAIIASLFLLSANAQSTGTFSKVETRNCKVWNPASAPNVTVYWIGKCKNGYGEGRGILSYGTLLW